MGLCSRSALFLNQQILSANAASRRQDVNVSPEPFAQLKQAIAMAPGSERSSVRNIEEYPLST
jgi:hypothetical protein